jgi:membrane-associated phospholipid phosphatase
MISQIYNSPPVRILILYLFALTVFDTEVFSQSVAGNDSVRINDEIFTNTNKINGGNKESSPNFYRTDSIFSFRSAKGYFPSLVHNIGEQAASPFHFKAKDWMYTGIAAGITTALIFTDEDIDEWARVQKQKHAWVNKSSPIITNFGSNWGIGTFVATGLISAAFRNEKGVQTSLLASQAFITSGIWAQLIKQLAGRERPKASYIFSGIEGGKWHGPFARYLEKDPDDNSKMSYDAFPSGHTATAFSIATVFALQYKDKKAVPVICYSMATLVGLSRLTEHEHWASDVFVGALIGYLSGKQVVKHFNKTHPDLLKNPQQLKREKTEITFFQDGNQIGLAVRW